MKRALTLTSVALCALVLLTGCFALVVGGDKSSRCQPTVGQQLTDLKKARDTGAMTEEEYQSQRAKVLAQHH
jgi:Short C-terminal domain